MLKENHIDIIGLNETRLDENIQNREVQIDGYQILRNDRNLGGGGVAFYVKDSLTNVKVELMTNELVRLMILRFFVLSTQSKNHAFCSSWYRRPTPGADQTTFNSLREILGQLESEDKEIILLGDSNCDSKDPQNPNTKMLKQVYNLYQLK